MQITKFPLPETRAFSQFFLDYIDQKDELKTFYHRFPKVENFPDQVKEKKASFTQKHRDVLTRAFERQYANTDTTELVKSNIALLRKENTFTITTGHQLNIFTGPLYFIYKIVTVINACKTLKQKYPDYNFVPVYWMASEDHDYDEIRYFRLYGKKYVWETKQSGAVGRFQTQDIQALLDEIPGDISVFKEAYAKNKTLSGAVRHYVNAVFQKEGLLVLDADDKELKSLFKGVIFNDVVKCATHPLVENTNQRLEKLGYKTQVFCRDVNFFYLDDHLRSRIEKVGDVFKVIDTDLQFTEKEITELIETSPEKFSPNVILRPLYQEFILPNLAYVGGPAEVVYWLQLKSVFDQYKVPFPMLMPRNFGLVIEQHILRKFQKTGLDLQHLFEDKNFIYNHWVLKNSKHNLTVGPERTTIHEIFDNLRQRAISIDPTLEPFVAAEGKRAMNSLEKIEKKLLRAEKRLQTDRLRQIDAVKDALFPNGSLQERTDNFLNFYQQDNDFIAKLSDAFDPFDYNFNVLTYRVV